ncbi:hypothetical protein ABT084_25320 [Streptomyces sp. NPDC002138]|uniref:hypothetical protein n=1 Tax=Streptomyces sp. NPDC002138 TaxID=3154410 RepID=UPI00331FCDF0
MIRNAIGSLLGLIGATAAVWSPFRAWYDGRHGRDYRLGDLFSGSGIDTTGKSGVMTSLLLPFLVAALLTLIAIVLRSRVLMAVAGVLVIGFTVLWMVRQGQAGGSLTVGGDGEGLGPGVAGAFGGGALLILAAAIMRGRPRRRPRHDRRPPADEPPPRYDTPTAPAEYPPPTHPNTPWPPPPPGNGH